MSGVGHDTSQLGAYVLGALDDYEASVVERHIANCAQCQWELSELAAARHALDEVPPEAFLDGPPDGGDVLLQRTLRRVRAEEAGSAVPAVSTGRRARARRRRVPVAAGIALLTAVALGGGVLVGRQTATPVAQPPVSTQQPDPAGVRTASGTDKQTGATMQVKVTPAAGWVRVHADVAGVKAGEACLLRVVPRTGNPMIAGSWLVSSKGESEGTSLDGSALVDPSQVAAVDVITTDGRKVISVGM